MGNGESSGQHCQPAQEAVAPMVSLKKVRRISDLPGLDCQYHLEKDRSLSDDYKVSSSVLGQGLCGSVVVATGRKDGKRYAVKTLRKQGVPETKVVQLITEVEINLAMDHPSIARVADVYESETSISMVSECCDGGELYAALQDKGVFQNDEAAEITRQMMGVVRHLHARSIVHRDLKMENFLFSERDPQSQLQRYVRDTQDGNSTPRTAAPQLKLIDFGFARVWDPSKLMMTACGSAEYVSPDVLCGTGYTNQADVWSIGVIVWMLLTGYPPFHGQRKQMIANIKAAKPDWSHQSRWKSVSQDAKDFVQKLLVKDPKERIDAYTALQHPWLAGRTTISYSPSCDGTVLALQRYVAHSKLQRAAMQMLVQHLDLEETRKLTSAFHSFDQNGKGWITVQDVQRAMELMEQSSNENQWEQSGFYSSEELFSALDANGDKRIYYTEFIAAIARVSEQKHHAALKATFNRLDADGSGSIGANDLARTLGNKVDGADVTGLLIEVRPQGGDICFNEFAELMSSDYFDEEVDVISPSKAHSTALGSFVSLFSALSTNA